MVYVDRIEMINVNGKIVLKNINGFRWEGFEQKKRILYNIAHRLLFFHSKDWKAVREFLVDVPRRLLVCAVPKSGSTSWHRLIWSIRRRRLKLSDDQSLYTPDDTIQNEAITQNLNKKEGDKLISSVSGDDDFTRNPPPNSTFRVILVSLYKFFCRKWFIRVLQIYGGKTLTSRYYNNIVPSVS